MVKDKQYICTLKIYIVAIILYKSDIINQMAQLDPYPLWAEKKKSWLQMEYKQ